MIITKENIMRKIQDGFFVQAKELIEKYLEKEQYNDDISSMEAIISIYEGDYSLAMKKILTGLEYNIFNSDLYFTMGNVFELTGEYNRAYLCYEKALTLCRVDENRNTIVVAMDNLKKQNEITVNNYSIVMLTYNNLEYTKKCIESIRKYNSKDNFEIIVIDNNSTDGTREWLKKQKDIKSVLNSENRGFPTGCNQGINLAKKQNDIFLLNNDTVLMPNSIFNLRMGLYYKEIVGATGAVSNCVPYYQEILEKFKSYEEYVDYAYRNNITDESRYEERVKLIGFAMFIKRRVLNEVGLLDERFTPGNFEDDDLSLRIILSGHKLMLCKDSYIHHFGSVSFKKNGKEFNKLLKTNSYKFKEKWGFYSEESMNINRDIISLIDEDSSKEMNILQIGCKCGATLLEIKNKFPLCNIVGTEVNYEMAKISSNFFEVLNKSVEREEFSLKTESFDYIILDNVIQSFYNPQEVLARIKKYLNPKGYVLATVPNVMHYSTVQSLINGVWNYSPLVDSNKNNIRQFTKHEIIQLFNLVEFKNILIGNINGYISEETNKFVENLNKISLLDISEDLNVYKYLIKAQNSKSRYDEIIQQCIFLLRRVEFDIDAEASLEELQKLIADSIINEEIIIQLVMKDIIDKVYVLNILSIKCFEKGMFDIILPLLSKAYELDNSNLYTNYNFAYVLYSFGEGKLALQYLNRLECTNEKIDELIESIRGNLGE